MLLRRHREELENVSAFEEVATELDVSEVEESDAEETKPKQKGKQKKNEK